MPDTKREIEQRQERVQQKKARDMDTPVEKRLKEGAQDIVQEARQDVAVTRLPWYRTIKRAYILLTIYGMLLVLFALLAAYVHIHPILAIDVTITQEFQESQNPWLVALMTFVSYPGSNTVLSVVLVMLAVAAFWLIDLRLEAATIAVVYIVSALLNALIKLLIGRPRPGARLVDVFYTVTGNSFPSGHVMSYVALWGLLFTFGIILFTGRRWWRIVLLVVSAFFVVMVGPSRVYLGAHWATDVLGAYLIGGVLLGITLLIYLQLDRRGLLSIRKEHTWLSASKIARNKRREA